MNDIEFIKSARTALASCSLARQATPARSTALPSSIDDFVPFIFDPHDIDTFASGQPPQARQGTSPRRPPCPPWCCSCEMGARRKPHPEVSPPSPWNLAAAT